MSRTLLSAIAALFLLGASAAPAAEAAPNVPCAIRTLWWMESDAGEANLGCDKQTACGSEVAVRVLSTTLCAIHPLA